MTRFWPTVPTLMANPCPNPGAPASRRLRLCPITFDRKWLPICTLVSVLLVTGCQSAVARGLGKHLQVAVPTPPPLPGHQNLGGIPPHLQSPVRNFGQYLNQHPLQGVTADVS